MMIYIYSANRPKCRHKAFEAEVDSLTMNSRLLFFCYINRTELSYTGFYLP